MKSFRECVAKPYCKGFPQQCGEFCVGFEMLKFLYDRSEMPARYQVDIALTNPDSDLNAFRFLNSFKAEVVDNVDNGRGLYIFSKNKGNAKTSWAAKIMNEFFRKIALTNPMKCRGVFVSVPQFLQDIRNTFNGGDNAAIRERMESVRNADLVIWDDIGTENPSNWVREQLYSFINDRYSNRRSQIFTSNLSLEQLANDQIMGERIASRIAGCCEIIEFKNEDRRENE